MTLKKINVSHVANKSLHRAQGSSAASLEKLSHLMDSSIRLPGGYRNGWD